MRTFDLIVGALTQYGPLVLGLAMLPVAVGVPVPVGMLLIAAGAFVRQGVLDWRTTFLMAWIGSTASDALSYAIGRGTGRWARQRLSERHVRVWRRAEERFRTHGGWAVFAASWLVRSLAIPTNLIAGSSDYSFARFIALDAIGKVLWILLHAGLGFAFASQWQRVAGLVRGYGLWLGLGGAAAAGIYLLVRRSSGHQNRAASHSA